MKTANVLSAGLNELVESLELGAGMLLDWSVSPSAFRRAYVTGRLSNDEWERVWASRAATKSRRRLEEKGWIQSRKNGDAVVVRLHKDAAVAVLRDRIKKTRSRLGENRMCFVVFDIPESAAAARQAWRRFLREARFGQVQRSVWACDRDVTKETAALIRLLNAESWFCVYVGHRVS